MRHLDKVLVDITRGLGVALLLTLGACGGSSDGGDTSSSYSSVSTSSSSSSVSSNPDEENNPPEAEAGENVSVIAGEQVFLEGSASDSDGNIVSRTWVQTSGPRVPLTVVDLEAGHFSFHAPNTGPSAQVTLEFRFTVTDDANAQASDTLEVTVSRVNQPPVVQTEGLVVVGNTTTVPLSALAYDPDGSIESYLWQQVAGEVVTIDNSTAANTQFILPSIDGEATFEFEVAVTDNEGLTASDTLTVVVALEDAPTVQMDFPPPRGAFSGDTISAYGWVSAAEGASIAEVSVDAGGGVIDAQVDTEGRWRADNIPLPAGTSQARIQVQALDNEGRASYAESQLLRTDSFAIGPTEPWGQTTAMLLAPDGDAVWLLAEGTVGESYKLMAVDLQTGFREAVVTDFTDESLGPVTDEYTGLAYDAESHTFFLIALPESAEDNGHLYRLDGQTGMRERIFLHFEQGTDNLVLPQDIVLHQTGELYIADAIGQLVMVEPESGSSRLVADSSTESEPVNGPMQLSWDTTGQRFVVMQEKAGAVDMLGLTLGETATSHMISVGAEISFGPVPLESAEGLTIDHQNNRAFVLTGVANNVTEIDLQTGERDILLENFGPDESTARDIVYDPERRILYGVAGPDYDQALYMIDPESGSKVTVSTSF